MTKVDTKCPIAFVYARPAEHFTVQVEDTPTGVCQVKPDPDSWPAPELAPGQMELLPLETRATLCSFLAAASRDCQQLQGMTANALRKCFVRSLVGHDPSQGLPRSLWPCGADGGGCRACVDTSSAREMCLTSAARSLCCVSAAAHPCGRCPSWTQEQILRLEQICG